MRLVYIPKTNLKVSTICLGTGDFGSALNGRDSFQLLDDFIERGGNFIDTAHVYGDWVPGIERSISEKTIGAWFKARGSRTKVVLSTKGAHPFLNSMHVPRMSRAEIVQDLDESLQFLQTDCIDIYWLHRDAPKLPVEEIVDIMNDQVKAGKIRYFGASNWKATRIEAAQSYAAAHGLEAFSGNQLFWNAAVLEGTPAGATDLTWMEDEMKAYHIKTGLAAMTYSSQAGGLFRRFHNNTIDQMKAGARKTYNIPASQQRYERMCKLMADFGLTLTQLVLGYLLSQPFTTIPLVGSHTRADLFDSLSAADMKLSPAQLRYIETGQ